MPMLSFALEGLRMRALLDTGADRSALQPAAAAASGLTSLIDESFARMVSGIGNSRRSGRIHYARVGVAGLECTAAFDIIDLGPGADFDAIFGMDFLVRVKATIDIVGRKLHIESSGRMAEVPMMGIGF